MAKIVRILVADDHSVVRAGLRVLLERQSNFRIVAEASTGGGAVTKALEFRPDIAVLDVRMPGLSGIDACRQILGQVEGCRVIMLTAYAESALLSAAIHAGASGYVLKRIGGNELVQVIDRVSRGESILDSAMTEPILIQIRKFGQVQDRQAFESLTANELSVLALVCDGMTNREIALKLYLAEGTVRNYVSQVLGKIGVSNRAAAAAYAAKHHIGRLSPLGRGAISSRL